MSRRKGGLELGAGDGEVTGEVMRGDAVMRGCRDDAGDAAWTADTASLRHYQRARAAAAPED
jgi:hypothetical protein